MRGAVARIFRHHEALPKDLPEGKRSPYTAPFRCFVASFVMTAKKTQDGACKDGITLL